MKIEERIDRVREAMSAYFGEDRRRIAHALEVERHARRLLEAEPGDRETVLAAALLHDIGIPAAERKYGSAAGHLQEKEGPPVAAEILRFLGYEERFIAEVCAIVGSHHTRGRIDTPEFRIIWDSDWLVNIPDEIPEEKRERTIPLLFMTPNGRKWAEEIYLGRH